MTAPDRPAFSFTPEALAALSPTELAAKFAPVPGTLGARLGIELLEASPARLVATMPALGNLQPAGRLHGGASAALIEELASLGSWLNLDTSKQVAVGVDLNVTHVRSTTSGLVRGVADLIYRGRTVLLWGVTITNEHGKVTSTGRCTCNVVSL